jgi:hypothetical protein
MYAPAKKPSSNNLPNGSVLLEQPMDVTVRTISSGVLYAMDVLSKKRLHQLPQVSRRTTGLYFPTEGSD